MTPKYEQLVQELRAALPQWYADGQRKLPGEQALAAQFSVSRQSVHDTVSRTEKQLEAMEEKLWLARRFRVLEDGLHACEAELSKVQAQGESKVHLQNALHIIAALRDQEEQ